MPRAVCVVSVGKVTVPTGFIMVWIRLAATHWLRSSREGTRQIICYFNSLLGDEAHDKAGRVELPFADGRQISYTRLRVLLV